ncbi:MAG: hypothetical protein E7317_02365 [Clostridiales bacterium]|nr:hypothetical protein [Clostridiales bacterium]
MWERFRTWASNWLGVQVPDPSGTPAEHAKRYVTGEADPVTRVIADRLASLTFADSTLSVTGRDGATLTARGALLRDTLTRFWRGEARAVTAQAFGKGGMVLFPVVTNRGVRIAAVDQSRLLVLRACGGVVEHAVLLADQCARGREKLWLAVSFELTGGGQVLRYAAFNDGGRRVALADVAAWASLPEELTLANADEPMFAWLHCPRDSRVDRPLYGVPVTYGAEALIRELNEHARIYRREYRLTRPMLGLDSTLWRDALRPGEPMDIRRVRRTVQDSDDPFIPLDAPALDGHGVWQYYAPAIRHEAMEARWQSLSRRIEQACGLSQGILTQRQAVSYANKDEVRAALYDTFTVVRAMRDRLEEALGVVCRAADRLMERYALTEPGGRADVALRFDWDVSLIESSSQTFDQMLKLHGIGAMRTEELRAWQTGETAEEAKEALAGGA